MDAVINARFRSPQAGKMLSKCPRRISVRNVRSCASSTTMTEISERHLSDIASLRRIPSVAYFRNVLLERRLSKRAEKLTSHPTYTFVSSATRLVETLLPTVAVAYIRPSVGFSCILHCRGRAKFVSIYRCRFPLQVQLLDFLSGTRATDFKL